MRSYLGCDDAGSGREDGGCGDGKEREYGWGNDVLQHIVVEAPDGREEVDVGGGKSVT